MIQKMHKIKRLSIHTQIYYISVIILAHIHLSMLHCNEALGCKLLSSYSLCQYILCAWLAHSRAPCYLAIPLTL